MKVLDLIAKTRSIRRYKENEPVSRETLTYIAHAARFVPSTGNMQRLRLMLVNDKEGCDAIFEEISFAAHLRPDWTGPKEGERPAAYIVVMTDKEPDVNLGIDMGVAAEAMLITAREEGLGGCIFRSFDREKLGAKLGKAPYMPAMVISIGYSDEVVIIQAAENVRPNGDLRYYRNQYGHHIVPKIPLSQLLID